MSDKLLLVGLGNPGVIYHKTRHNLGSNWLKTWCLEKNLAFKLNPKLNAYLTELAPNLLCMLPNCYMNVSGEPISKVIAYHQLDPLNMLVIHDDLDLAIGTIKLKLFGGHGGHNGLRHIIQILKTDRFKRLRIGIGKPTTADPTADYVLAQPPRSEQTMIDLAIAQSFKIIPSILACNWQQAMQILHQPKNSKDQP